MDQTAVTTQGACAESETAFLVNIWLVTALNPSFSVVDIYHPLPQRAEDSGGAKCSCRLH